MTVNVLAFKSFSGAKGIRLPYSKTYLEEIIPAVSPSLSPEPVDELEAAMVMVKLNTLCLTPPYVFLFSFPLA